MDRSALAAGRSLHAEGGLKAFYRGVLARKKAELASIQKQKAAVLQQAIKTQKAMLAQLGEEVDDGEAASADAEMADAGPGSEGGSQRQGEEEGERGEGGWETGSARLSSKGGGFCPASFHGIIFDAFPLCRGFSVHRLPQVQLSLAFWLVFVACVPSQLAFLALHELFI